MGGRSFRSLSGRDGAPSCWSPDGTSPRGETADAFRTGQDRAGASHGRRCVVAVRHFRFSVFSLPSLPLPLHISASSPLRRCASPSLRCAFPFLHLFAFPPVRHHVVLLCVFPLLGGPPALRRHRSTSSPTPHPTLPCPPTGFVALTSPCRLPSSATRPTHGRRSCSWTGRLGRGRCLSCKCCGVA